MTSRHGFIGSEHTTAVLTIYPSTVERGVRLSPKRDKSTRSMDPVVIRGKYDGGPMLLHLETHKAFGSPSGSWAATVKVPREDARAFYYAINDDDWVEISFYRHTQKTVVMYGLIDKIRRKRQTTSTGATEVTFLITGSDHGKIFAVTPIFFDMVTDGASGLSAVGRVLASTIAENPARTVEKILAGFLSESARAGRGTWRLPASFDLGRRLGLPAERAESFLDLCAFFARDYVDVPQRKAEITANLFSGFNTSIWGLAEEWSDPLLSEVYVDLLEAPEHVRTSYVPAEKDPSGRTEGVTQLAFPTRYEGLEYPRAVSDVTEPSHTRMVPAVIFRDRPFPARPRVLSDGTVEDIWDALWFDRLPKHTILPEEIGSDFDIGRSGHARYNAFYIGANMASFVGSNLILNGLPVWDPESMKHHGLRRFEVRTNYTAYDMNSPEGLAGILDKIRRRVRDFHAPNHLWSDGTLELTRLRPEIRIGSRVNIPDYRDEWDSESYYVEGVSNTWTHGRATTKLTLTHGWIGDDATLVYALREIWNGYKRPEGSQELKLMGQTVTLEDDADLEDPNGAMLNRNIGTYDKIARQAQLAYEQALRDIEAEEAGAQQDTLPEGEDAGEE